MNCWKTFYFFQNSVKDCITAQLLVYLLISSVQTFFPFFVADPNFLMCRYESPQFLKVKMLFHLFYNLTSVCTVIPWGLSGTLYLRDVSPSVTCFRGHDCRVLENNVRLIPPYKYSVTACCSVPNNFTNRYINNSGCQYYGGRHIDPTTCWPFWINNVTSEQTSNTDSF